MVQLGDSVSAERAISCLNGVNFFGMRLKVA